MTASNAERSQRSRRRAKQLEEVRREIDRLRHLVRQPFVRDEIPRADVRAWLDDLSEMAGENEE